MRLNLARFNLPLLRKELVEQASRRRTYIIRATYATLMFGTFGLYYLAISERFSGGTYALLGLGRQLFEFLITLQFVGIYLFLPAMMSAVVTQEKERDSLGLLLLTDLSPWEILLEKYFGRLLAMFGFLLLGLPLLAVCYSLGGVTREYLIAGVWLLFVACLQVGAIALMFSAWCRTSISAFLSTYAFGFLFYCCPVIAYEFFRAWFGSYGGFNEWVILHFPPAVFSSMESANTLGSGSQLLDILTKSSVAIVSVFVFLLLARWSIVRRAFIAPRNHLLRMFGRVDGMMTWANQFVGGYVLIKSKDPLPLDDPVAWREVTKKALGQTRYLLRLLLLLQLPTVFILLMVFTFDHGAALGVMYSMSCLLWAVATLTLTAKAVNTIASERIHQTLEVLLTTPMSGAEIVLQKMQGLKRVVALFWVPLVSVILIKAWWLTSASPYSWNRLNLEDTLLYLFAAGINLLIFPPLLCWFAVAIGLRVKSRSRAVMVMFAALLAWFIIPLIAAVILGLTFGFHEEVSGYMILFSPAACVAITESVVWASVADTPLLPILISLFWHGYLWYRLRGWCLNNADRLLGRVQRPVFG